MLESNAETAQDGGMLHVHSMACTGPVETVLASMHLRGRPLWLRD